MPHFNVSTTAELAKLLLVAPQEIDEVNRNRRRYYRNMSLGKPDGGSRHLRVPEGPLKVFQDKVRRHVLSQIPLLDCVHGGIKGRSAVTNAKLHIGKQVVFILDVKDFFPSVGLRTVRTIFSFLGFSAHALEALIDVTTWDNQLPQGAPTSLAIANLAMYGVDVRLSNLARKQGFAYTRYSDDLTLSGSWRLLDFRRLAKRIIEEEGFIINPAKVKTMPAGSRQVVTGIVVNKKLNLPKERRDLIRREVFSSRGQSGTALDRTRGQLAWLSSVNPQQASRLRTTSQFS